MQNEARAGLGVSPFSFGGATMGAPPKSGHPGPLLSEVFKGKRYYLASEMSIEAL